MSKERLEEIKEYFGLWMKNDISRDWSLSSETIDNLKYLIEQAERVLELEVKLQGMYGIYDIRLKKYDKLEQQYKRCLELLEG